MKRTVLYLSILLCLAIVSGMAYAAQELLVAQFGAGNVVRINSDGTKTVVATGLPYSAAYGYGPRGVAFGPDGKLYVAVYGTATQVTNPVRQFDYPNGDTTGTQLALGITQQSRMVVFDPSGYLWVSAVVSSFSTGKRAYRWTGPLMTPPWAGPQNLETGHTNAQGLAISGGYLYMVSGLSEVWKISLSDFTHTVVGSGLTDGTSVAVGPDGSVYVADFSMMSYKYGIQKFAADGTPGWFYTPVGSGFNPTVVYGPDNKLYLARQDNGDIQRVNLNGTFYDTYATGLNKPYGLTFAPIPEPGSLLALASGLIGLVGLRRFRRR